MLTGDDSGEEHVDTGRPFPCPEYPQSKMRKIISSKVISMKPYFFKTMIFTYPAVSTKRTTQLKKTTVPLGRELSLLLRRREVPRGNVA